MNELMRFLLARPPNATTIDQVKVVNASYIPANATRSQARVQAEIFIRAGQITRTGDGLATIAPVRAALDALADGPISNAKLGAAVAAVAGSTVAVLVARDEFTRDERAVQDSLVGMKLLSKSFSGDALDLSHLVQGYDAIRALAAGKDPIALRVLSLPD